jgi:hypothetical protein
MDVTFSESEMYFASPMPNHVLPGETNAEIEGEIEGPDWFEVVLEAVPVKTGSSSCPIPAETVPMAETGLSPVLNNVSMSSPLDSSSVVTLERLTSIPDVADSVYDSLSRDSIVPAHAPVDIPEVSNSDINISSNPKTIEKSYQLPPRQNRGHPPDRFSPEGKARYSIAHYVSSHRLTSQYQAFVNQMAAIQIPSRVEEALKDPKWIEAMNVEMEALQKNKTWDIVSAPRGKKPVGCRWVFTIKHKADGTIDRYKARLVAKGYADIRCGLSRDFCTSGKDEYCSGTTVLSSQF